MPRPLGRRPNGASPNCSDANAQPGPRSPWCGEPPLRSSVRRQLLTRPTSCRSLKRVAHDDADHPGHGHAELVLPHSNDYTERKDVPQLAETSRSPRSPCARCPRCSLARTPRSIRHQCLARATPWAERKRTLAQCLCNWCSSSLPVCLQAGVPLSEQHACTPSTPHRSSL